MTADDELRTLQQAVSRRTDLVLHLHELRHRCGTFVVPRVASKHLDTADTIVLVQAGLHGDEKAGPLTLIRHLDEVVDHAHAGGVALILYPLVNPSGFDANTRYNGDHDRGSAGNGDFLRYRLADGTLADEVAAGVAAPWIWSSDLDVALPAETRLLHQLLRREPLERICAALDLHQDCLTPNLGPASYAYAFGDLTRYQAIVAGVRRVVPLVAEQMIGAGFGVEIGAHGETTRPQSSGEHPCSDANGFVVRHDGSLTDLFFRLGAAHSIALETTGATPMADACAVNLLWIKGLIDLVTRRG